MHHHELAEVLHVTGARRAELHDQRLIVDGLPLLRPRQNVPVSAKRLSTRLAGLRLETQVRNDSYLIPDWNRYEFSSVSRRKNIPTRRS
eukprot:COSAG01_NODE_11594_length_1897_cov_10.718020_2_plen_89_part_00